MTDFNWLQLFADAGTVVNTLVNNGTSNYTNAYTGDAVAANPSTNTLAPELKTFYDTELLENARTEMFYAQFGRKQRLPKNGGTTIEWRKFNTFDRASELKEGVIPTGQQFGSSSLTASISQYGTYTSITDKLEMRAYDNVILAATEEMGASAAATQETLIRNALLVGTNVMYCDNVTEDGTKVSTPTSPATMGAGGTTSSGGSSTPDGWALLTPTMVNKAVTKMKKDRVPRINGKYYAVIHPSVAYDLRQSKEWIEVHKYAATGEIFNGEIGELHGVRFVETTEAKIYRGEDLAADSRTLKVNGNVMASTDVTFNGGTVAAGALAGRYVVLGGTRCQVVSNTDAKLVLDKTVTVGDKEVIYPGEGGKQGCAVYGCLFLGKGAYGVVDLSEGTEVIVKPRGSSGTADPLDQRSSVGWKGVHAAAILYDEYMVRVECGSSYSDEDKSN